MSTSIFILGPLHPHTPPSAPSLPVSLNRLRAKQGRTEGGGHKRGKSSEGWESGGEGREEKQRQAEELHVSLHHSLDSNLH